MNNDSDYPTVIIPLTYCASPRCMKLWARIWVSTPATEEGAGHQGTLISLLRSFSLACLRYCVVRSESAARYSSSAAGWGMTSAASSGVNRCLHRCRQHPSLRKQIQTSAIIYFYRRFPRCHRRIEDRHPRCGEYARAGSQPNWHFFTGCHFIISGWMSLSVV